MPCIARQVGVSTRTLCRWRAADTFPERTRRTGDTGGLDPSTAYLQQRWAEGCHNATHLGRDLQAQGFPGSYHGVAMYVAPLRRGQPVRRAGSEHPSASTASASPPALTARPLSYLLVRAPRKRTTEEQERVTQVQQHDGRIAQVAMLTEDFAQMVRARTADRLTPWLDTVAASPCADLKRFAQGLRQDAAVHAALAFP